MKRLQTILITGSLPVKLNIEKTDQISPVLGQEFLKNIGFVGILVIVAVGAVIFARYRNIKISGLIMMTVICEVVIILGVASAIRWNIDLSAIAGLLIAVGTGVDQQIVITNETMQKETAVFLRWKDKIKNAFFMIMGSYLTVFVAMLPLMWAGVGLLKGFAITTIIGASAGVFIARPAFAAMLEVVFKEE
jgi:preprotein translocase subunit SecD